jgi:hypothetical protein
LSGIIQDRYFPEKRASIKPNTINADCPWSNIFWKVSMSGIHLFAQVLVLLMHWKCLCELHASPFLWLVVSFSGFDLTLLTKINAPLRMRTIALTTLVYQNEQKPS